MEINNNLSQISAEMLLNYFYPELEKQWTAHHEGTFYRNYSQDVLELDEEERDVILARDGFIKMLPEGLLFDEKELKGKDFSGMYKQQEQRRRTFLAAFLPLDTFNFRQRLHLERNISKTLDMKLDYVLKTYFGFDFQAEQNPYVKEMASILPFIREWRADFKRIARLLGEIFHCKTRFLTSRYSDDDNSHCWIPGVEYQLLKPSLTAEEFRKLYEDTRPLEKFLIEWLMPAEVHCRLSIKDHRKVKEPGTPLLLDYNTELNP